MYCRNCGAEMNENAVVCVKCGVQKNGASNFCQNCGKPTNPEAIVCVSCGVSLTQKGGASGGTGVKSQKTKMVAGLLAIFLGHLGLHEFYLGNKQKAIYKIVATVIAAILFLAGIGIIVFLAIWGWNIYDAVMIFTGKRTDSDGNELQ